MSSSGLILRLARPGEAAAIANLSRRFIEYGLPWRWTPARVAASIRAANVNVLVAAVGEKIGGFAIMRYGDDKAHLDLLAVVPAYRRLGIAAELLDWLHECAKTAGIFNVTLEVREQNEAARSFYKRMGYESLGRISGYYEGQEAAVRMGRDLSAGRAQRARYVRGRLDFGGQ